MCIFAVIVKQTCPPSRNASQITLPVMRLSVLFLLGVGVSTTIALPVEIFGADDRPEDERENGRLGACIMSVLNRAVSRPLSDKVASSSRRRTRRRKQSL